MFEEKAEWHIQQYFFRYFIHSIERGFKIVKSIFSTYFARGMYIYPFVNVPTSVVFSGPNVFSNICIASLKSFVMHYVIHLLLLQYVVLTLNLQLYMLQRIQSFLEKFGSYLQIESAIFLLILR